MTSHELAKKLLKMDDVMVVVRGYEGGVNEVQGTSKSKDLALNVHSEWYYGKHEFVDGFDNYENHQKVKAIYIGSSDDED